MDRSKDASSISSRKMGRNFSFMSRTSRDPARNVSNASQISSAGSGVLAEKPTFGPSSDQRASASTPTPPEQRRQSRMSLFDLFSKPKVERARGFQENSPSRFTPSIERPRTPAEFYRQMDTITPATQSTVFLPRSRPSQRASSQRAPKITDNWEPPPHFQAIPQAIKHGMAHGVNTSAESIARAHQYRSNPLVQDLLGEAPASIPDILAEMGVHTPKEAKRHSTVAANLNIVSKQFVLVTAGRLVQYAGKGGYDRLPEKVLHLGADSAAFACDLIPGKHWVLQIVQHANEDSAVKDKHHRSLFSRIKVPSIAGRKNVSSFLMIFDGGEDMDLWLKAIRKVINDAGGRPHTSDPVPGESENNGDLVPNSRLHKTPSHRFLAQRDPRAPSRLGGRTPSVRSVRSKAQSPPLDTTVSSASPLVSPISPHPSSSVSSPMERRASLAFSGEAPSVGTSSASSDHVRLSELRDGSRHSSSSADTAATSRCSSSPPSPVVGDFTEEEKLNPPSPLSRSSSFKNKRFSVQTHSLFDDDIDTWLPASKEAASSIVATPEHSPIPTSLAVKPLEDTVLEQSSSESTCLAVNPAAATESTRLMPAVIEEAEAEKPQRPTSTVGQLPDFAPRNVHRMSQVRSKPFARPLPVRPLSVRPSEADNTAIQTTQSSTGLPVRRPGTLPHPPASTAASAHPRGRRSHATSGSYSLVPTIHPNPDKTPSPPQAIRRPSSVQISTDRVAFLSSRSLAGHRSGSASPTPPTEPPLSVQDAKREAAARRQSFTQYMLATSRARAMQVPTNIAAPSGVLGGPVGGVVASRPAAPLVPAMNPRRHAKIRTSLPVMSLQNLPPPMPPPTCPLPMLPPTCPLPIPPVAPTPLA